MLDAKDYPPGTPVYSFVDKMGVNWHIDSAKLRVWCLSQPGLEIFNVPIDEESANGYIIDNVVDRAHVLRVLNMKSWDPLIFGKFDTFDKHGRPDVMHIDGHHRYVAAAMCKLRYAPAYLLDRSQWEPFQIIGLADLTEDYLRRLPARGQHKDAHK